jgi:hypothetical protein
LQFLEIFFCIFEQVSKFKSLATAFFDPKDKKKGQIFSKRPPSGLKFTTDLFQKFQKLKIPKMAWHQVGPNHNCMQNFTSLNLREVFYWWGTKKICCGDYT